MPAFQAARRYLNPVVGGSLEVYGFLPAEDPKDNNPLWQLDQRPDWWRKYASVAGESLDLPPAFTNDRLATITHEPLLCYLLALAGYATEQWELAADNRNRIYAALMSSIYNRVWGEGVSKRQGPGRGLSQSDFNKLMETIALAAWHGGDSRVASMENFERAIELTGAKDAWEQFREESGAYINNLAMNFYMKASEKEHRGFEFTHKSFGEYLLSKSLINIGMDISMDSRRKVRNSISEWIECTSNGISTIQILNFSRDECRLMAADPNNIDGIINLKNTFDEIVKFSIVEGFPCNSFGLMDSVKSIISANFNSESSAWMVLNSSSMALKSIGKYNEAMINVIPQAGYFSLRFNHPEHFSLSTDIRPSCLANLYAPNIHIYQQNTMRMDLSGSVLSNAIFSDVGFYGANFTDADMAGARFYDCEIISSIFSATKLDECYMIRSMVADSTLNDSVISEIYFDDRTFTSSSEAASDILDKIKKIPNAGDGASVFDICEKWRDIWDKIEILPEEKSHIFIG